MPYAIANCTCRTCGKEFERRLEEHGSGAGKRLREKVEWAEDGGIAECPDCYKARKREEEKAAGLTCEIRLGNAMDPDVRVYAVFGGDSYSHKDELKAAGCRWTDEYPTGATVLDLIGLNAPPKAWVLTDVDPEILLSRVKRLGASTIRFPSQGELRLWGSFRADAIKLREERAAAQQAKLEELGPIPAWPESVSAKWPDGAKWNGKIYGRAGSRSIYLSGNKVDITDEEATAMTEIAEARSKWRNQKSMIEAGA